ncbi:ABC transporter substrate-binding protein [Lachnospiraceae bacterium NSJ-143]|nr:ABC transporter substrate-binding protein [Lachnospiraceae bacterium NSJ-143]
MKKIILAAAVLPLIFTACSDTAVPDTPQSSQKAVSSVQNNTYEKDDNVLTLSMRTTTVLNPLLNEDESVDSILRLMFKPLIAIDSAHKPQGCIAESWYYTQDGTVLTIKIKSGLKWHDGSDITANDVAYSINTIRNAGDNTVYKKCAERIRNVSLTDRYTVNVSFSEAFSSNIYSMCFPVISESYYSGNDSPEYPMGNGPYKFSDFTPAKELVLEASENSFGGTPSIGRVVVKMTTDSDTDIYSFSQKITDCVVAGETDMGKYDFYAESEKYGFTDNYYEFIGFNFNNSVLRDKNIRKAVAACVPIDNIIDSVYLSNAVKTSSPVNPSSFLYNTNIPGIQYDLNKAKEYISLAGYKYDSESNLFAKTDESGTHNISLRILVNSESKERRQVAIKLSEELKSVGIKSGVEAVNYNTYISRLESGDFDLFVGGWEMSVSPYFGFMFSSSDRDGLNYISYSDEKMDELLDTAYNAVNEADMVKAYSELEAYTADELPYVSLLFRKSALFVNSRISGDFNPVPYDYFRGIESWKIETNQTSD